MISFFFLDNPALKSPITMALRRYVFQYLLEFEIENIFGTFICGALF